MSSVLPNKVLQAPQLDRIHKAESRGLCGRVSGLQAVWSYFSAVFDMLSWLGIGLVR